MNNRITFLHSRLVIDTCCLINLFASKKVIDVLKTIPVPVSIAEDVYIETVRPSVQPCIDQGLLTVEPFVGDEYDLYVQLAFETRLGNGELATAAIAASRNWGIGIDENRARKQISKRYPHLQMLTTPELMKCWVDTVQPTAAELQVALHNIEQNGNYMPSQQHPLSAWWDQGRGI